MQRNNRLLFCASRWHTRSSPVCDQGRARRSFTSTRLLRRGGGDFYELLGVPSSATQAEVKAAFRRKALNLHPDVRKADSKEEADKHGEQFVALLECAAILSDPSRRAEYDRSLQHRATRPVDMEWDADYDHPIKRPGAADFPSSPLKRDQDVRGGRGWSYTASSGRRTSGDAESRQSPPRGKSAASADPEDQPQWVIKYQDLVSQGLLQRLIEPVAEEAMDALETAYYGPAFYGPLWQILDFEAEVRNPGLVVDSLAGGTLPLLNLVSGRQLLGHVRERQILHIVGDRVKKSDALGHEEPKKIDMGIDARPSHVTSCVCGIQASLLGVTSRIQDGAGVHDVSGAGPDESTDHATAEAIARYQRIAGPSRNCDRQVLSRNRGEGEVEVLDLLFRGRVVAWSVVRSDDRMQIFVAGNNDDVAPREEGDENGNLIAEVRGKLICDDQWQQPSYCLAVWTPPHLGQGGASTVRADVGTGGGNGGKEQPSGVFRRREKSETLAGEGEPSLVESYSLVRYNTPGVVHLYLMQNWDAMCSIAATQAVALPAWMRIFEPRQETHQHGSWCFERRASRAQVQRAQRSGAGVGNDTAVGRRSDSLFECQVVISVLVAAAHSLALEKLRRQDGALVGWARVRRFLLG